MRQLYLRAICWTRHELEKPDLTPHERSRIEAHLKTFTPEQIAQDIKREEKRLHHHEMKEEQKIWLKYFGKPKWRTSVRKIKKVLRWIQDPQIRLLFEDRIKLLQDHYAHKKEANRV